jgi:hypothetical protein
MINIHCIVTFYIFLYDLKKNCTKKGNILALNKLLKTSLNWFDLKCWWTLFFFVRRWLALSIYKLFEIIYIQSIYILFFLSCPGFKPRILHILCSVLTNWVKLLYIKDGGFARCQHNGMWLFPLDAFPFS